jgi:hypothetical protein
MTHENDADILRSLLLGLQVNLNPGFEFGEGQRQSAKALAKYNLDDLHPEIMELLGEDEDYVILSSIIDASLYGDEEVRCMALRFYPILYFRYWDDLEADPILEGLWDVNERISLAALMALKEVGMMSDDALVVQYLTREAVAKIPHSNIRMILSDVLKDRNWSEIDKLHSKTQSG